MGEYPRTGSGNMKRFSDEELEEIANSELNLDDDIVAFTEAPSDDETRELNKLGVLLFRLETAIDEQEKFQKRLKQAHFFLVHERMPQRMSELGVRRQSIDDGSGGSVEITRKPYYKANIAADWPPEQREAGFEYLAEIGGGEIIRSVVSASVRQGDHEKALELASAVSMLMEQMELQGTVSHDKSVPWNTLTAWLKAEWERGETTIDLDKLGAYVGEIVTVKKGK